MAHNTEEYEILGPTSPRDRTAAVKVDDGFVVEPGDVVYLTDEQAERIRAARFEIRKVSGGSGKDRASSEAKIAEQSPAEQAEEPADQDREEVTT